jgi:hypothetical protein
MSTPRTRLKRGKPYKIVSNSDKILYGIYMFSRGSWDMTRKVFQLIGGGYISTLNRSTCYYTITEEELDNIKVEAL